MGPQLGQSQQQRRSLWATLWTVVTAVSMLVWLLLIFVFANPSGGTLQSVDRVVAFVALGAALGVGQRWVMRLRVPQRDAIAWLPTTVIGWSFGALLASLISGTFVIGSGGDFAALLLGSACASMLQAYQLRDTIDRPGQYVAGVAVATLVTLGIMLSGVELHWLPPFAAILLSWVAYGALTGGVLTWLLPLAPQRR